MKVDASVLGIIDYRLWKDLTVSNNYDKVGRVIIENSGKCLVTKSCGSIYRNTVLKSKSLCGGGGHNVSSAPWLILTADNRTYSVSVSNKTGKTGSRYFGRTHKHNIFHYSINLST